MSRRRYSTGTKGRACQGKRCHPDRQTALTHLRWLVRSGADPKSLNVYRCPHGDHRHVGHTPGHRTRSRR